MAFAPVVEDGGALVITTEGGTAAITLVSADVAEAEPTELVAVTLTSIVDPTSAAGTR